jgi:hypothetical protein
VAYKLYDINNNEVTPKNLQARAPWYAHGETQEVNFVKNYGSQFNVGINPAKQSKNTAPDLQFLNHPGLADLKCQNTPFFFARIYKAAAQTSVTFNLKDALEYQRYLHSGFQIFFWVEWQAVKMVSPGYPNSLVNPISGVWQIDFSLLNNLRKNFPIHWYGQRAKQLEPDPAMAHVLAAFEPRLKQNSGVLSVRSMNNGNAACSYIIDLNQCTKVA